LFFGPSQLWISLGVAMSLMHRHASTALSKASRHAPLRRLLGARPLMSLRVAGVPEHFFAPFLLAKERGLYAEKGLDFEWVCTPQGTGAMAQALEAGDIDVAMMVSEGGVAKTVNSSPFKVVGTYVRSPLRLGIHVRAGAGIKDVADLKGKTFGISRYGSSSHLMSYVLASMRGWNPKVDAPLKVVNTLQGAREAMGKGEIDCWIWEKFTTKHIVDCGEWDILEELHAPWHPFLFVASEKALAEKGSQIRDMVQTTKPVCDMFKANDNDSTLEYVAKHHGLSREDAVDWLGSTQWDCQLQVEKDSLDKIQEALVAIGQVDRPVTCADILDENVCSLV